MESKTSYKRRRGRGPAKQLGNPDLPYPMKLPDGRTLYLEGPGRWVVADRGGKPALVPDGVAFLDRVRALAIKLDRPPGPGYIVALREALGMTQKEFAERIGVDKMTVSRWERGALRPSDESLAVVEQLRKQAVRRGVTIPA